MFDSRPSDLWTRQRSESLNPRRRLCYALLRLSLPPDVLPLSIDLTGIMYLKVQ